ncbi:WD repeat-containing protein 87 [Struthio camelus]|uniref:WD repeat-containing protein 87 n=1 Tax=Struthio camelus TaxID=8801 RepID=UPI003603C1F9
MATGPSHGNRGLVGPALPEACGGGGSPLRAKPLIITPKQESRAMLAAPQPAWRELRAQILQRLRAAAGPGEASAGSAVRRSDHPALAYRAACPAAPVCFCPSDGHRVFVAFAWERPGSSQPQAHVWLQRLEAGSAVEERDVPLAEPPRALRVCHVPPLRLLAAYCSDLRLRLFGDHRQDLALLAAAPCPHAFASLCYSPDTGELVAGGLGVLAWWALGAGPPAAPSPAGAVRVPGGELVQQVQAAPVARALVALCESTVRLYDARSRAPTRALAGSLGVALCVCALRGPPARLYAGDSAGYVQAWSLRTGRRVQRFQAHRQAVSSAVVHPAGQSLLTASLDGLVKEWGWAHGDLLRQLDLGEPVLQLGFAGPATFYCSTPGNFSLHTLRDLHRLFHTAGSPLRRLAHVPCGSGRARILAATEDGTVRFLSPVTGQLLLITWPYQLLEQALDYVYDPDREQLAVTVGTADVYVLDTTRNPCPAKYVLRTAASREDRVLCLAFCRLRVDAEVCSCVFAGYRSGCIRALSCLSRPLPKQQLHQQGVEAMCSLSGSDDLSSGSHESSFLCSYGSDERIVLSSLAAQGSELVLLPVHAIASTNGCVQHLLLVPGAVCAVTENCLRVWGLAALARGEDCSLAAESPPMHSCTITSCDYCPTLQLLVTGAADGSIRLWSLAGVLVVDFSSSLKFSRVCFASRWGDLLVGCNCSIFLIPCFNYLPRAHLQELATYWLPDNVAEEPLCFLPSFLQAFETIFVPTYQLEDSGAMFYEGMEVLASYKQVIVVEGTAKVRGSTKAVAGPQIAPERAVNAAGPSVSSALRPRRPVPPQRARRWRAEPVHSARPPEELARLLEEYLLHGLRWPIAPDGLVPNSVVRACLWPSGTPDRERSSLQKELPRRKRAKVRASVLSLPKAPGKREARQPWGEMLPFLGQQAPRDLLAEIASQNWLLHKPESISLEGVVRGILGQMEAASPTIYTLCTAALVQITESYVLPPILQAEAYSSLFPQTTSRWARRRRAAWQTLGRMALLTQRDLLPLAHALMDKDEEVRDLARSLLRSITGITDKAALRKAVQGPSASSLREDVQTLDSGELVPLAIGPPVPGAEGASAAAASPTELDTLLQAVEERLTSTLSLVEEQSRSSPETEQKESPELPAELGGTERAAPQGPAQEAQLRKRMTDRGLHPSRLAPAPSSLPGLAQTPRAMHPQVQQRLPKLGSRTQPTTAPSPLRPTSSGTLARGAPALPRPGLAGALLPAVGQAVLARPRAGRRRDATREAARGAGVRREPTSERLWAPQGSRLQTHSEASAILLRRKPTGVRLREKPARTPGRGQSPETPLRRGSPWTPLPRDQPGAPPQQDTASRINPQQRYGSEEGQWRDDLCKLLGLRTTPSAEERQVMEELMALASKALSGDSTAWRLLRSSGDLLVQLQRRRSCKGWAGPGAQGPCPGQPGAAEGAGAKQLLELSEEEGLGTWPGLVEAARDEGPREMLKALLHRLVAPQELPGAAELPGWLQALQAQLPVPEQRLELQALLAAAASAAAEEDEELGEALWLCARLVDPQQPEPGASIAQELAEAHRRYARRAAGAGGQEPEVRVDTLLACISARLQVSRGQPSLHPGDTGTQGGREPTGKVRPLWPWPERAKQPAESWSALPEGGPWPPVPGALQTMGLEKVAAMHKESWADAVSLSPARLGQTQARQRHGHAEPWPGLWPDGKVEESSTDKLLALHQVLMELRDRHGADSEAWREALTHLLRLYRLQCPRIRYIFRYLLAGDPPRVRYVSGKAERPGKEPGAPGERVLCQVLHPAGPRRAGPPAFCPVAPLSYRNNVHVPQPWGEAVFGALALRWYSECPAEPGTLPPLHFALD